MNDVQVDIDEDGDGVADATAFPDDNGVFFHTPEGLSENETRTLTAWARVPDLSGELIDLDQAFLDQIALGATVVDGELVWPGANDDTYADGSAEAWLDELFVGETTFGGDWYHADFEPELRPDILSDPRSVDVTLGYETDANYLANRLTIAGLQLAAPGAGVEPNLDPTVQGTVSGDASVDALLLEFYFVETVNGAPVEVFDGEATTDVTGAFAYTPQRHSTAGNHLRGQGSRRRLRQRRAHRH